MKKCAAILTAALVFLANKAFADTGVFLKDTLLVDVNRQSVVNFAQGAKVFVAGESEDYFIVNENNKTYYMDKQNMLIVTKKVNIYKVNSEDAVMYTEPNTSSKVVKKLELNEVLYLDELDGKFGLFYTEGKKSIGYVPVEFVNEDYIEKENVTQGIATAAITVKNDANKYLHIQKADILYIKDFKDNQYVILDDAGNEFYINPLLISFNGGNVQVSRSSFNRKNFTDVATVVKYAYDSIGKPYVYADIGRKGYDCSGLMYAAFLQIGLELPRSSSQQAGIGTYVKKEDLAVGDLIFFNTSGKGISHVGLYIGNGKMIHASTGSKKVKIDDINSDYYYKRYVTARRIIEN